MKRFLSALLALTLALGLAACGGSGDAAPAADSGAADADTAAADALGETEPEPTPELTPEPTPEPPDPKDIALDGEQVLMDQDGVKVTATDLQYGKTAYEEGPTEQYYALTVKVENHSGQDLISTADMAWLGVVNGKTVTALRLDPDSDDGHLAKMIVKDGAEEEWELRVYGEYIDSRAYDVPALYQFCILPSFSLIDQDENSGELYSAAELTEIRTNAADPDAVADPMPADLAADDEDLSVALSYFFHYDFDGLVQNGYEQYMVDVLCRNNTDRSICLKGTVETVNGQPMQEGGTSIADVLPGMVCEVSVPFDRADLQAAGIDSYADITELTFSISGYENTEAVLDDDLLFTVGPMTADAAFIADNYISAKERYGE